MNALKRYLFFLFLGMSLTTCLPIQSVFLGLPDAKDLDRSASHIITRDSHCFSFHRMPIAAQKKLRVNDWTSDIPFFVELKELTQTHKVRSCLVIQRDTILYEYYGKNMNEETIHPSYSVAKSVISALVGIAIDEGYILSENDLVINYLPNLKGNEALRTLTIKHLLNQTSGIKYSLGLDATIYYGTNVMKGIPRIRFAEKPGTKQHYININTQLLGLILEAATNQKPSAFFAQKIWQPLGMCQNALWSSDQKGIERTFCCLGATALDYAKFARLYLHQGQWEGQQLISKTWYNKSIRRDSTEGSSFGYNYSWYIGLKEYGDFMAIGLYKQYLYINPTKELLIILLNDREKPLLAERVMWQDVFRQIADQL